MTLDLVLSGHEELVSNEAELIDEWIIKKIERDLTSPRLGGNISVDIDTYVYGIIKTMKYVAVNSRRENINGVEFEDEFELASILDMARTNTGVLELTSSTLISTSLFIPVKLPKHIPQRIRFFHRRIQEHLSLKSREP